MGMLWVAPRCIRPRRVSTSHGSGRKREETDVTALYTFDVYSTLDGYGSYGPEGDWGGYWGKQGPEFLDRRLALYHEPQRLVLGANTMRMFMQSIGPQTGFLKDVDRVNGAMRSLPTIVVSSTLDGPLDWPDATLLRGDAVTVVARLKEESDVPLRSHGSLSMNRALMAAGVVDRVQVTLFPVVSGQTGTRPIFEGASDFDLELLESRTLDGHTLELTYRPTLHA
jgi:dihydrofolate reductase